MSIKAIGKYFNNFFKLKESSFIDLSDFYSAKNRVTLTKNYKYFSVVKDEVILGNKRIVVITKNDYSQYPVITTVLTKEKEFENGKLVKQNFKKYLTI